MLLKDRPQGRRQGSGVGMMLPQRILSSALSRRTQLVLIHQQGYAVFKFPHLLILAQTNLLTLTFDFHIRADKHEYQSWEVDCVGLLEHQMFLGECDDFDLSHDHPLLWPYIYPRASVSFYGEAEQALAVFGALYQRHLELSDWIPFGRFMNGNS